MRDPAIPRLPVDVSKIEWHEFDRSPASYDARRARDLVADMTEDFGCNPLLPDPCAYEEGADAWAKLAIGRFAFRVDLTTGPQMIVIVQIDEADQNCHMLEIYVRRRPQETT